jgi:hypothetical protein
LGLIRFPFVVFNLQGLKPALADLLTGRFTAESRESVIFLKRAGIPPHRRAHALELCSLCARTRASVYSDSRALELKFSL